MNLKDLSSGLEASYNNTNENLNSNKIKILENKISIYQKENQALKNKVRILQDSNDEKNTKIQEQLNHLTNLKNDNNSLKKLYDNSKKKFNTETNNFYTNKREQEKEITNMKYIIDELKSENEKLLKSISIQNKENKNLQQNLLKTASENKLYSQDNTILLSKVKEYEDNLFMINNNNIKSNNNNQFIQESNNICDNKLSLYSSIINDEINIIAKYIDTYLNLNYIENMNLNIPQLQKITSFPDERKFSGFSNIINSVENAFKRIMTQNKFIKNNELMLKQEINKLNNILEKKNNENIELKREISELKRKFFYLKNDFDKINNDLSSQKGFNKKIQNTMNEISSGNDDYIKGLYQTIKNELDKILNEPLLHSYLTIILEQRNNFNNNFANNGMKYIFEEILDKYILINNCIVEDFKKTKSEKNYGIGIGGNFDMGGNVRELEIANDDLKNKLIQKDKIISNNKDEKKLLINQINILQRDILNLRNKNINIEKNNENKSLNFNYNDNLDNNNNYLSMPILPHKQLISNDNNEINALYKQPYIEEQNNFKNNNNIENYDNDNMNNEEIKDNQNEEEEEENEIYYEGQQFPNQPPSSDLYNNNNFDNMQNNYNNYQQQYMNNEQNENENENEENNEFNNNQFQEIIEEEENENNTMEGESNKNKSIKNSNINNNVNMNYNYNLNNDENNNNLSEEEYINENQINNEFMNKNKSLENSKNNENIENDINDGQIYNMYGKNMENKGMKDISGNIEVKENNNQNNNN